jgi:molybdenum cofactor biosynthesis protein B
VSIADHKAASPTSVACFVVTVSDTRTLETETSGRAIAELLEGAGHRVADRTLVKDEPADVARVVNDAIAKGEAQVVITTGGTGLARRDSTYEALVGLFDKRIDGFGELFRALSFQEIGAAAMLSRATAGVIDNRAVFLLPGSEHAVRLAMNQLILPALGHLVGQLERDGAGRQG